MKKMISILFVLAIVGSVAACRSPFSPKSMAGTWKGESYYAGGSNVTADAATSKTIYKVKLENNKEKTCTYSELRQFRNTTSDAWLNNSSSTSSPNPVEGKGVYVLNKNGQSLSLILDKQGLKPAIIAKKGNAFYIYSYGRVVKYTKQ